MVTYNISEADLVRPGLFKAIWSWHGHVDEWRPRVDASFADVPLEHKPMFPPGYYSNRANWEERKSKRYHLKMVPSVKIIIFPKPRSSYWAFMSHTMGR